MLYKSLVIALKNPFVQRAVRRIPGQAAHADNYKLISKYAAGKSFVDVGCMWGVNGSYSFRAEEAGAAKVAAVDIYPESKKFLEGKNRRNSAVEFIKGDVTLLDTTAKIGLSDIVFCSEVLYHTPDPVHLLLRLRSICREILILNTQSIPEMPGIKNAAVFYPFLDEKQRKIWARGICRQRAITGPYEPESGYGNWFWGFSPSCVESMLKLAGFEAMERHIYPFNCLFVCRPASIKFTAI